MKLIIDEPVDGTTLDATNVAETVTLYSATAIKVAGQQVRSDTTHHVYESVIGTNKGAATISNATPAVVGKVAHGLAENSTVAFTTTGALPPNFAVNTIYYVRVVAADTFQLSATSGGASIAAGGAGSGTHTLYADPNLGYDPTSAANVPDKWLDVGPTNPWAMFDESINTVTTNADTIDFSVTPTSRASALAFFGLSGASLTVTYTDAIDGVVFGPETYDLTSYDNVGSYYDYFFEPVIRKTELIIDNLPLYAAPQIDVVIDNTGGTAECGAFVMGQTRQLGATLYGAGFGIIDYSRKETDDFGITTLVERSYRSTARLRVAVEKAYVNELRRVLASRRARLTVFAGDDADYYTSLLVYGFPKDWDATIEQPTVSYLDIQLEGVA